ncbi:MAG: ABC transporter substrate-binding protein [Galactobacter sp.]
MFWKRARVLSAVRGAAAGGAATTGCSSSGSGDSGAGDGGTRQVIDIDDNSIEVPTKPTKVVTLSEPTTDAVLALGVKPVGIVAGRGQDGAANYLADKAKGIPIMGAVAAPNYEAIGKADPDLILVDGTSINNNQQAIDTLTHIAPVVYTGYAGGDWRKNFEITADAMNMKSEGKKVLSDFDAKVDEVKAGLAEKGLDAKTYSIVRWQGNAPALILKELPPGQALTQLGMKRPAAQDKDGRGHSEPVSLENIDTIDADYMFFGSLGGSSVNNPAAGGAADDDAAKQALADAKKVPGFSELNSVKNNQVIPVDGSVWTSTGGPLLMQRIVSDIEANLLEK